MFQTAGFLKKLQVFQVNWPHIWKAEMSNIHCTIEQAQVPVVWNNIAFFYVENKECVTFSLEIVRAHAFPISPCNFVS